MRSRIGKTIGIAAALAVCMLFTSCTGILPSGGDVKLSIPTTTTVTNFGEMTSSVFFHDKIIKREDGLYEVFGRRLTERSDQVDHIRFLYLQDGTPIGDRNNSMSSQDSIYLFDALLASYTAGMEDTIDRVEDNRIYFLDGGYADLELDGDRILTHKGYGADGKKFVEFKFNTLGQLEYMKQFDEDGNEVFEISTTYQTVAP